MDGGGEDTYFQKLSIDGENSCLQYETADVPLDMNPSQGKNTAEVISLKMGIGAKQEEDN